MARGEERAEEEAGAVEEHHHAAAPHQQELQHPRRRLRIGARGPRVGEEWCRIWSRIFGGVVWVDKVSSKQDQNGPDGRFLCLHSIRLLVRRVGLSTYEWGERSETTRTASFFFFLAIFDSISSPGLTSTVLLSNRDLRVVYYSVLFGLDGAGTACVNKQGECGCSG